MCVDWLGENILSNQLSQKKMSINQNVFLKQANIYGTTCQILKRIS